MAYRVAKKPTFTIKVVVVEPGDADSGEVETSEFTGRFKRVSDDELVEIRTSGRSDKDIMREMLVGWADLTDENGAQLPFSEQFRDTLLSIPHALRGVAYAFMAGASGAGLKN
ncbi:hypothetical protein [Paraburkholderia bryophila]|uniref:Tail assembly chaperone n=1 Tax=Paraburkholderia bryophila TaxID=420952 RepID=A0A7Z0AXG4_9BURK|nr:hypothetical protein [Paraburkholderia bryophila]NYH13429.1 hypothetical protein [Paraburkholderia bryophila]